LEASEYAVRFADIPAGSVGADHIRRRLWLVGYADRYSEPSGAVDAEAPWLSRGSGEPGGVVQTDGVSGRMAQLRAFGNAIVPAVAAEFIGAVMECLP